MTITYIGHSGFLVELADCYLLFDYFEGDIPALVRDKPLYVFVSHKHEDHFNPKIFKLPEQSDYVRYLLGSDVKLSERYLERLGVDPKVKCCIGNAGKNQELLLDELVIRTLRSTDAGVAFVVEAKGKRIYHAGDLNWWHWAEEPQRQREEMEKAYKAQIDRLAGTHFDAAFVPLDPRLGEAYDYGVQYFMEKTDTAMLFPMHMWGRYDWIVKYKESPRAAAWADRIALITKMGQQFEG